MTGGRPLASLRQRAWHPLLKLVASDFDLPLGVIRKHVEKDRLGHALR